MFKHVFLPHTVHRQLHLTITSSREIVSTTPSKYGRYDSPKLVFTWYTIANIKFEDTRTFDPNFPVPYWHQDLELVFLCLANSLSRKSKIYDDAFWLVLSLEVLTDTVLSCHYCYSTMAKVRSIKKVPSG
jgi:hypothetical protein